MEKQGKIWGITQSLFLKNNVEIHRIEVNKDGYCSKHKHDYKYNCFFVERGQLKISIWKNDGLVDKTILSDQETLTVPPKWYHMFEAIKDTIAYEIYWTEIDAKDITRENCGGKDRKVLK